MQLIYSALREKHDPTPHETKDEDTLLRYKAYLAVCRKYRQEIAAIKKHFPNWQPAFKG